MCKFTRFSMARKSEILCRSNLSWKSKMGWFRLCLNFLTTQPYYNGTECICPDPRDYCQPWEYYEGVRSVYQSGSCPTEQPATALTVPHQQLYCRILFFRFNMCTRTLKVYSPIYMGKRTLSDRSKISSKYLFQKWKLYSKYSLSKWSNMEQRSN